MAFLVFAPFIKAGCRDKAAPAIRKKKAQAFASGVDDRFLPERNTPFERQDLVFARNDGKNLAREDISAFEFEIGVLFSHDFFDGEKDLLIFIVFDEKSAAHKALC